MVLHESLLVDHTHFNTGRKGYADAIPLRTLLGRDHHYAIGSPGAVQRRSGRTFQDVDGFDVFRVNVRRSITVVEPITAGLLVGVIARPVVDGHAIYNEQRLVVAGNGLVTPDDDVRRAGKVVVRADLHAGDLSRKGVDEILLLHLGNRGTIDFLRGITERRLFTGDVKRGDHYFGKFGHIGQHHHIDNGARSDIDFLCLKTNK